MKFDLPYIIGFSEGWLVVIVTLKANGGHFFFHDKKIIRLFRRIAFENGFGKRKGF